MMLCEMASLSGSAVFCHFYEFFAYLPRFYWDLWELMGFNRQRAGGCLPTEIPWGVEMLICSRWRV
jgi:hypothetical protein